MRTLLIIIVLVIILGGGYYLFTQNTTTQTPEVTDPFGNGDATAPGTNTGTQTGTGTQNGTNTDATTGEVKEFTVSGENFTFSPSTMTVERGDTVRITFNNVSGTHDLRVDGYNVGTEVIQGGQSETFEFVADRAGSFEYYCSVGQHREMGMVGTLTVTE